MKNKPMNKTIRIGGAQIPVTPSIQTNADTIKQAIDWASENNVDYLVTPEASLSGYSINCLDKKLPDLILALGEIEAYAKEKTVGLCLGTIWQEIYKTDTGELSTVNKNQIRYYTPDGIYLGSSGKTVMTELDTAIGVAPDIVLSGIAVPFKDNIIPTAGLICADIYGWGGAKGGLPQQYHDMGVKLFIHATNGERNTDPVKNEIEEIWVEAWLRRVSMYQRCPIIVVDNCYMMDGTEYHGNTLTQSGVLINGVWVTSVPRTDTQYFYHDLELDDIILKEPIE